MRKRLIISSLLFLTLVCSKANAWFGHYYPQDRSQYIEDLLNSHRPLAASNVMEEMLNYCEKKNDENCLVYAYFTYGQFLTSEYVATDEWYKKNGYGDKSITFDNIHQKSMEYFQKALALAQKQRMYAEISGICIKIGIAQYWDLKDKVAACDSFDQSLEYHLIFEKNNPTHKVVLPKGFNSFGEYIAEGKKEMGCAK